MNGNMLENGEILYLLRYIFRNPIRCFEDGFQTHFTTIEVMKSKGFVDFLFYKGVLVEVRITQKGLNYLAEEIVI